MPPDETPPLDPDDARATVGLLEAIVDDRSLLAGLGPDLRKRLLIAAGRVSQPSAADRRALRQANARRARERQRADDKALLDQTRIRQLRANPIFETPRRKGAPPPPPRASLGDVHAERVCYICRARFTDVHWFYDQLCLPCGDFNHARRTQAADLAGRTVLVTGARVKIGYQAAIQLLRNGAHVVVLTRFPVDAAARYGREEDFEQWADRLEIHGIDLRHTPSVERLCGHLLAHHRRLDALINNACQTVRRPPGFYAHMMERELALDLAPAHRALVAPRPEGAPTPAAQLSQIALLDDDRLDPTALFPADRLDADLQQVDLREQNSWRLRLHEVSAVEMIEVHLVNAVAPALLNARLKPLLAAVPTDDAHVVNVSAMEGQFYRTYKSDRHPHTNMAKASLNMLTRTSAADYIRDGVHMNSVDTGWVTDEDPLHHAQRKREEHDFHPPLDIVDGAARILDPFIWGLNTGEQVWGQFLKDYKPTDW